jgi:hypothetical protein
MRIVDVLFGRPLASYEDQKERIGAALRGVRDTGAVFLFPTYLFVGSLVIAIGLSLWKTIAAGGHPMPVVAPPPLGSATESAAMWLLLWGPSPAAAQP